MQSLRSGVWGLALLANFVSAWLVWTAISGIVSLAEDPTNAGFAVLAGASQLVYAIAISIIATSVALCIDKGTR